MAASHASPHAPAPSGQSAGFVGRLRTVGKWLLGHPLVAFPLLAVSLLGVIGGIYGLTQVFFREQTPVTHQLELALRKLDAGDFGAARQLASEIDAGGGPGEEKLAAPMFILGAVMMHDAEEHLEQHKRELLYRVAARYLEEARDRGLPEDRAAEGLRLLGISLHGAGNYAQSVPVLEQAIELTPEYASSLRWLLIDACLNLSPPDLAKAELQIDAYLKDPQVPLHDRHAGLLKLAETRLAAGNAVACRQAIEQLHDAESLKPDALLLAARAYLLEADAAPADQPELAAASIQAARKALEELDDVSGTSQQMNGKADYLLGICLLRNKDLLAAEKQFLQVRQKYFNTEEAFAATVQALELLHKRSGPHETVVLARKLIAESPPAENYHNVWMPLAEVQQRLAGIISELTSHGDYEEAITLATILPPLVAQTDALLLRAQTHLAAAHELRAEAAKEPFIQAGVTLAEARDHERSAGEDYGQLAELRFITKHYEEDLWKSGENLLSGQAYAAAAKTFRRMLKQEVRLRRPEVLIGLGESLLALGQADQAAEVLARCLEDYPKHPASYRARLIAAYADSESGRLAEARQKLNDNLYGFSLTPESSEWRDSLFALGRLLMVEGQGLETKSRLEGADSQDEQELQKGLAVLEEAHAVFEEAAKVFTEAVRRFPQAPDALLARYRIAEAHRHAAKLPRKKLAITTIETTRVQLNRQIQHDLGLALEEYGRLLAQLDQEQTTQRRNPLELQLVRNCYFERADVLFDLGRYDEALTAYSAATNRYQAEPEALEAYVQIAACYRRLEKHAEARGTLEQARVVLKRIRADADFTRTTRYNREEWGNLLAWLGTL